MASCVLLLSFLLVLASTTHPTPVRAWDNFGPAWPSCSTTDNYTVGSQYQVSLFTLLDALRNGTIHNGGYANATVGSGGNLVYGLLMCYADRTWEQCVNGIQSAATGIMAACPFSRTVRSCYDPCVLRYSDTPFFATADTSEAFMVWNKINVTGNTDRFMKQVMQLMWELAGNASASPQLLATGNASFDGDFQRIQGLAQCTRDLPSSECYRCLQGFVPKIPGYFGTPTVHGGAIKGYSCYLRYNLDPFAVTLPQPDTESAGSQGNGKRKSSISRVVVISVLPGAFLIFIIILSLFIWRMTRKKSKSSLSGTSAVNGHKQLDTSTVESLFFDLSVLKIATNNFAEVNRLGDGGFGTVYKGLLPSGSEIAVKRLSETSKQGLVELKNELVLVAKLQHKNLVKLLGVCLDEGEKLLVYEYMANKSLDTFLFDPDKREQLNWQIRHDIICGIARGLLYLQEDSQLKIVHRDLKASNILLDEVMTPKISDFGMARLFPGDQTRDITRRVVGTRGYMAPEYATLGQFSVKSDIFSFGVLILEIMTGRRNIDFLESAQAENLLTFVWQHWMRGTTMLIMDPLLRGDCPESEAIKFIHIGLLCVQENPTGRPTTLDITVMIHSGDSLYLPAPSKPAFIFGSNDTNSTVATQGHVAIAVARSQSNCSVRSRNEVTTSVLDPR